LAALILTGRGIKDMIVSQKIGPARLMRSGIDPGDQNANDYH
jgi:hypothetical protein